MDKTDEEKRRVNFESVRIISKLQDSIIHLWHDRPEKAYECTKNALNHAKELGDPSIQTLVDTALVKRMLGLEERALYAGKMSYVIMLLDRRIKNQ